MTDYLGYLALGTGAGAIIAAMALGLLLCQQGASIVNFSIGASMTWTAHVYADLRRGAYVFPFPGLPDRYQFGDDVGLFWAMVLALATAALLGLLLYRLVFRPLYHAPSLSTIVANIGIIIIITTLVQRRFEGGSGLRVDPIFPNDPVTVIGDITMPQDGLWVAGVVVLLGILAWLVTKFTRVGLVTRAAASNEKGVILLGFSPIRLAQGSYIVATVLTGLRRHHRLADAPAGGDDVHLHLLDPGSRCGIGRSVPQHRHHRRSRIRHRHGAVVVHEVPGRLRLVAALRRPRGPAVPGDHRGDVVHGRDVAEPRSRRLVATPEGSPVRS